MLSFKDIKIIETTLHQELDHSSSKAFQKVYQSVLNLLSSRLRSELQNNFLDFHPYNQIKKLNIRQRDILLEDLFATDYIKLKYQESKFYWTQEDMVLMADSLWRPGGGLQLARPLYGSDIYMAKTLAFYFNNCLRKAVKPIVNIDDYRVNNLYKAAVEKLKNEVYSFFMRIEFEDFTFKLSAELLFDQFFLEHEESSSDYEALLVSV